MREGDKYRERKREKERESNDNGEIGQKDN